MDRRVILDKKELKRLYIRKKISVQKIAKMKFCSTTTVTKNLKSYGIPRRSIGESNSLRYGLTPKKLKKMLKNKNQKEIAEHIGCDTSTISKAIKKFKKNGEW
jgi:hypothetical protein